MEANASIAEHRQQVKEDAANAGFSKARHVTDYLIGLCHGDFDQTRDGFSCKWLSKSGHRARLPRLAQEVAAQAPQRVTDVMNRGRCTTRLKWRRLRL